MPQEVRIQLRRPQEEDRDVVFEKWASDPEVTKYMAWATHRCRDDFDAFIALSDGTWDAFDYGPVIIEDLVTGEVIGSAGLLFDDSEEVGVGYILRKEYWGKGYATEALRLSIDAARDLGVKRLVAGIHPAHIASRNVCKKCGFAIDEEKPAGRFIFPQIDPDNESYTVRYILDLGDDIVEENE
ncbi:MAG: GNAT family N-acetyltransferase [Coriobacteriia bacterium]|nr:GNAT family N-acetyltransferase [Coriobacteriia bacterium]